MITNNVLKILNSKNDKEFLKRVYSNGVEKYITRLKAIDFQGKINVLDAGCGFGQWTFALAELNQQVEAFDFSKDRIDVCKELQKEYYINSKIKFKQGNLEQTEYKNNSFDLIFCYSVIFLSDFQKSLKELYRILKPGGKLYICANDIGWYLYNLENDHNSNEEFSSKSMALKTIKDTITYFSENLKQAGSQTIMPIDYTIKVMKEIGFKNIIWDGEGMINLTNQKNVKPFFQNKYKNELSVFELIGEK